MHAACKSEPAFGLDGEILFYRMPFVILQSRFSFENVEILPDIRDVMGVILECYQNM